MRAASRYYTRREVFLNRIILLPPKEKNPGVALSYESARVNIR
jgi:hypothetical protein